MALVSAWFGMDLPPDSTEIFAGLHDPAVRWNGWACPRFPRSEVDRIVAWCDRVIADSPFPGEQVKITWDGDVAVLTVDAYAVEDPDGYEPDRIEPDAAGLYAIGSHSWTWGAIEVPESITDVGPEMDAWLAHEAWRSRVAYATRNAVSAMGTSLGIDPLTRATLANRAAEVALAEFDRGPGQV